MATLTTTAQAENLTVTSEWVFVSVPNAIFDGGVSIRTEKDENLHHEVIARPFGASQFVGTIFPNDKNVWAYVLGPNHDSEGKKFKTIQEAATYLLYYFEALNTSKDCRNVSPNGPNAYTDRMTGHKIEMVKMSGLKWADVFRRFVAAVDAGGYNYPHAYKGECNMISQTEIWYNPQPTARYNETGEVQEYYHEAITGIERKFMYLVHLNPVAFNGNQLAQLLELYGK